MSQIHVPSASEPPPPVVPTQVTVDVNGPAIPVANNLNLYGRDTNENNDNGIRTKNDPNGSDTVYVELTNRVTGAVTTTDATPTTLISVSLGATPGVYLASGDVTAYDVTDLAGASYTFSGAAITDGATATEIGSEIRNEFEQLAMAASDFTFGVSGNNATVVVTGIAGKVINWSGLFTYRFVG